jgi:hypothetical protein
MRHVITIALAGAVLASLGGCGFDTTSVCAIPPCGAPSGGSNLSLVGFPPGRVDRTTLHTGGYHGVLHVGDEVTLHLERSAGTVGSPVDTVRAVAWALTDSAAASIVVQPGGGALLSARAPGPVGYVKTNGTFERMLACTPTRICDVLSGIDVLP